MDLNKIIGELRHEKERLDRVIASLEELQRLVASKALKTKLRSKTSLKPNPSENPRQG
jgi:hypothetical protein